MTAETQPIEASPRKAAPKGAAGDGLRLGASEKAESVFHAAQRHSVRVRVLKTALPIAAVAIAAVFSWYTFFATSAAPLKIEVDAAGESGKLVMANPHLSGYTKDNHPYSMTAAKATQDAKKSGVITLEGIQAELPLGDKGRAKVQAASGVYDSANERLQLDKDFSVTTSDGLQAALKSADVNIKSGQIVTDQPVDIRNGTTHIQADAMQVLDHGAVLIFENKVHMVIDGSAIAGNNKLAVDGAAVSGNKSP